MPDLKRWLLHESARALVVGRRPAREYERSNYHPFLSLTIREIVKILALIPKREKHYEFDDRSEHGCRCILPSLMFRSLRTYVVVNNDELIVETFSRKFALVPESSNAI